MTKWFNIQGSSLATNINQNTKVSGKANENFLVSLKENFSSKPWLLSESNNERCKILYNKENHHHNHKYLLSFHHGKMQCILSAL